MIINKIIAKFVVAIIIALTCIFFNTTEVYASEYNNEFSFAGNSVVSVDGNFSDWDSLPASYEYNWDNSQNCWYNGVWVNDVCYKTEEGTYDTNVRHKIQTYCDGSNVYLHIVFSRDYGSKFNGEDYQFYVDGEGTKFQVEFNGGGTITGNLDGYSAGVIPVDVKHANSAVSGQVADGSTAFLKINENNVNNEIELKIPLTELQKQNGNINIETMSTLEFFTPNLMYRSISSAGTPIGTTFLVFITSTIAVGGFVLYKKRDKV